MKREPDRISTTGQIGNLTVEDSAEVSKRLSSFFSVASGGATNDEMGVDRGFNSPHKARRWHILRDI
jgi:hypothetical protein